MRYTLILSLTLAYITSAYSIDTLSLTAAQFKQLESNYAGRIGIAAINTADNTQITYRANERFAFCSTAKFMAVAAILDKSKGESTLLNKHINYTIQDIKNSGYAPVAQKNLNNGMNVQEMCAAALDYSDNLAMNMLVKELGGIANVNSFARKIGDNSFTLSRKEPELNTAIPNDTRDTTTPLAMAKSLRQVLFESNPLTSTQKQQLLSWLQNNTTGDKRIRAGTPQSWLVGDKTGTGEYGTTNDIGIIQAPNCPPIVIAVYYTQDTPKAKPNDEIIAHATRIVIDTFAQNNKCLTNQLNSPSGK